MRVQAAHHKCGEAGWLLESILESPRDPSSHRSFVSAVSLLWVMVLEYIVQVGRYVL